MKKEHLGTIIETLQKVKRQKDITGYNKVLAKVLSIQVGE